MKVVNDKAAEEEKANTTKPDRDLNDIENTNMKIADTDKKETIEHMKRYVERSNESEGEQLEANWHSWRSTPVEDTSRNSNDTFPVDTGEKICSDEISQGKVIEGEDARLRKPDKASIPLVKI